MALERGFRRIVILLSILFIGLGLAVDAMIMLPHAIMEVTLKDGRQFVLPRHTVSERLGARDSLAYALKNGEGMYKGNSSRQQRFLLLDPMVIPPPPDYRGDIDESAIANVTLIDRPSYWWWVE